MSTIYTDFKHKFGVSIHFHFPMKMHVARHPYIQSEVKLNINHHTAIGILNILHTLITYLEAKHNYTIPNLTRF